METKNYLIRESQFDDYKYFAEWEVDPFVTQYLSYDEDRTYEDVVEEAYANRADDTKIDYTIVDKMTGEPIGRVFLSRIDRHSDSLDITKIYIGNADYRGKGVAREVLEELLRYCFIFLHLERVTLDYYTGNVRASSLYEKMGFKPEGVARNSTKKDGKYYDLNLMSMLKSEYLARYSAKKG
ncbi:MAG: GNAT family N-acetyltransferase [Firmicutes bacterium]|nr:GNAT family N-acetyltransferase [Bacillota bacterium]